MLRGPRFYYGGLLAPLDALLSINLMELQAPPPPHKGQGLGRDDMHPVKSAQGGTSGAG